MHPLRGILLKIASVCVFVAMSSLIKATAGHVPSGQAVFFRSFFAIPVIVVWLAMRRELHLGVRTSNPLGHFWRGLIGTISMGLGFAGLGLLPLPEVTAIGYASPLLVVIFAAMFLNEKVGAYRLGAVALGMAGVLIVLSPRLTIGTSTADAREALGAMLVLGAAFFASLAQVFVRKLVATESTATIVFWFSVTASALSTITIFWGWVIPAPREAIFLIIAGLLGGVGQILLTSSYRLADASVIAPFEYTSMILAIGVGFFVFGEVPTPVMLIGAAIIISAGVIIILREHYLGLERAKQRKAMTPSG
ncbi:MAG TPA: DMT family transporter [Paracoccaceae bacterium]|nr:DMT family transporter [Paracoccaceae bacterium]